MRRWCCILAPSCGTLSLMQCPSCVAQPATGAHLHAHPWEVHLAARACHPCFAAHAVCGGLPPAVQDAAEQEIRLRQHIFHSRPVLSHRLLQ